MKVKIVKEVKRSDGLWRFACGDVFLFLFLNFFVRGWSELDASWIHSSKKWSNLLFIFFPLFSSFLFFRGCSEFLDFFFFFRLWSELDARARWFQLFVMESFGELSYSAGYRKKHSGLYGFGVGGLLYPAQALPMWQNSIQGAKNRFLGFLLFKSDLMLAISTQPSSVTNRNIMDRMEKVVGTAYTPHQCSYGDRKLSSLGGNLQNTFCALFYLFTLN